MSSSAIGRLAAVLRSLAGPGSTSPTAATLRSARSADEGTAGFQLEYSPRLDGDPDPGEVVWTWVPFEEDPSQGKDRPVAIIGRRGQYLVGVPLTSKDHHNSWQVAVGTGPWDPSGRPSFATIDRVLDVVPHEVRREGAVLPKPTFDAIVAGVARAHRGTGR
jgi:hypothetical protein